MKIYAAIKRWVNLLLSAVKKSDCVKMKTNYRDQRKGYVSLHLTQLGHFDRLDAQDFNDTELIKV